MADQTEAQREHYFPHLRGKQLTSGRADEDHNEDTPKCASCNKPHGETNGHADGQAIESMVEQMH